MGEIISVISSAGGLGKSTFASLVSRQLSIDNIKTLLLEISDKNSTTNLICGVYNQDAILNFKDYLIGDNIHFEDVFLKTKMAESFYIGFAPYGIRERCILDNLPKLVNLKGFYDKVVLDIDFRDVVTLNKILYISDKIIFVCDSNHVTVTSSKTMIAQLNEIYYNRMKFVVNKLDVNKFSHCYYDSLDDIIDLFGIELLGVIPLDRIMLGGFYEGVKISEKLKLVYECIADRVNRKYRPLVVD